MGMGMVGLLPDHTIIPLLAVQDDHSIDSHHHHHRRLPATTIAPIHFWQQQQQQQQQHPSGEAQNYLKKPVADAGNLGGSTGLSPSLDRIFNATACAVTSTGIGIDSSGSTTCQDCGNQAKKDCIHRRCRTCCKSRGFECSTHVKSTWVPAARRRERQLHAQAAAAGSSASDSTTKKPRLISSQTTTTASHTSTSNTTPPRSFDSGSSHPDASYRDSLPGQVRAPAVFKCVRVTAIDDGEDEYAYQAVVKIGGHVFKGFLYDQGVDSRGEGIPNFSDLHLGGARNARHGAGSSSPIVDPSDVYGASGPAGLLGGGTGFGNPIN
ncbi:protein LATERAL ROOT PRIMORDIUM 1-like [Aristolochia californica]|uniref:protein LATERAL ROOT PRIMORDIUM 1-like n=1 Tax=Aristolochia californica TaxID=171875 RepID=UPI0035DFC0C1